MMNMIYKRQCQFSGMNTLAKKAFRKMLGKLTGNSLAITKKNAGKLHPVINIQYLIRVYNNNNNS